MVVFKKKKIVNSLNHVELYNISHLFCCFKCDFFSSLFHFGVNDVSIAIFRDQNTNTFGNTTRKSLEDKQFPDNLGIENSRFSTNL